jgi:hypothetical protein
MPPSCSIQDRSEGSRLILWAGEQLFCLNTGISLLTLAKSIRPYQAASRTEQSPGGDQRVSIAPNKADRERRVVIRSMDDRLGKDSRTRMDGLQLCTNISQELTIHRKR